MPVHLAELPTPDDAFQWFWAFWLVSSYPSFSRRGKLLPTLFLLIATFLLESFVHKWPISSHPPFQGGETQKRKTHMASPMRSIAFRGFHSGRARITRIRWWELTM